nr:hypothetical protein [Tanacetum cinerariifolium]
GKHTKFSVDDDGVVWFEDRLCVPSDQTLREKVMTEPYSSSFTVHPGERLIKGPELIEITNEKVAAAKEKLKEARSRQKSYADKHRRDLEFQVGDRVFMKIQPDMSLSEEPESILDQQERVMRNKTIPFVKILWKNHLEHEATWEIEESMRASYPRFFS